MQISDSALCQCAIEHHPGRSGYASPPDATTTAPKCTLRRPCRTYTVGTAPAHDVRHRGRTLQKHRVPEPRVASGPLARGFGLLHGNMDPDRPLRREWRAFRTSGHACHHKELSAQAWDPRKRACVIKGDRLWLQERRLSKTCSLSQGSRCPLFRRSRP